MKLQIVCSLLILLACSWPTTPCRECEWQPDPRCPGYYALDLPGNRLLLEDRKTDLGMKEEILERNLRMLQTDEFTFALRLHWEEGFCWQEEWIQREYCMECEGDICGRSDILSLQYCDEGRENQFFTWVPSLARAGAGRLKAADKDFCLEKIGPNEFDLQRCNYTWASQLFLGFSYDEPFELRPLREPTKCINQHHDPWPNEEIISTACTTARRVNTNQWEIFMPRGTPPRVTPKPTPPLPSAPKPNVDMVFCFPGDATVEEQHKGRIPIRDLQLGDQVMVSTGSFSPVYSFGHYNPYVKATYLSIGIEGLEQPLEISSDHMLFLEGQDIAVPASMVSMGDRVKLVDEGASVVSIRIVTRQGAFAPFSKHGTLVVNEVVVSSYVSLKPNSSALVDIGDGLLSLHFLAHVMESPHRMICMLHAPYCASETYNGNGLSSWIIIPLRLGQRIVQQENSLALLACFLPVFGLALVVYATEIVIGSQLLCVAIMLVILLCSMSFLDGGTSKISPSKYFRMHRKLKSRLNLKFGQRIVSPEHK